MPNFDEFFPFDPGFGASASAARWRKMANLWIADGVVANYLNQMNGTLVGNQITVQSGAVFIHGYYAEIVNSQTFTVGTNGTIVAQANFNTELVALVYRDTVVDYGSGGYEQDTNIWEIPIWGISGGNTLLDLRNLINPATGLRWSASQPGSTPIASAGTLQSNFGLARIPYVAQGFLHGTLLLTFSDLSQAQSAICQMTYQWGAGDQQVSPTITPANSAGFAANTSLSMPVALTGAIPVTQGKKTFGWRVTAGTGPGIQVSQMTLSLWTGGRPPVV
jgi:hypothetical protein